MNKCILRLESMAEQWPEQWRNNGPNIGLNNGQNTIHERSEITVIVYSKRFYSSNKNFMRNILRQNKVHTNTREAKRTCAKRMTEGHVSETNARRA